MAWPTTSRHERGYGSAWDKLRLTILKRDKYLCRCDECKKAYRLREATQVDHRVPKAQAEQQGWTQEQIDHPSNLQAINEECHRRKTDIENGRRLKATIGPDGWPSHR